MKSDPAREHHDKMRAIATEWERKLAFKAQRAYLDISDVYWLAHDFLNELFAAEGHRTEEELGVAVKEFKHDFLLITPHLSEVWQNFFTSLSHAQYGGNKPDPEQVHQLFVQCRTIIDETMRAALEPVDDFTRHLQALKILVSNGEIPKAEEQYKTLQQEYEKLPDERKILHYERFHDVYQAILVARNAQQA